MHLHKQCLCRWVFCVVFNKATTPAKVNTTVITAIHSLRSASRQISVAMQWAANTCSFAPFQFHLLMARYVWEGYSIVKRCGLPPFTGISFSSAIATDQLFCQFQLELQVGATRFGGWQMWRNPFHYICIADGYIKQGTKIRTTTIFTWTTRWVMWSILIIQINSTHAAIVKVDWAWNRNLFDMWSHLDTSLDGGLLIWVAVGGENSNLPPIVPQWVWYPFAAGVSLQPWVWFLAFFPLSWPWSCLGTCLYVMYHRCMFHVTRALLPGILRWKSCQNKHGSCSAEKTQWGPALLW